MTTRGLDYAWSHVPPLAVKAAGFGFVARYLSHDPAKNLSKAEASALLSAGVAIVLVWEDTAQGALRGYAGGVADAANAAAQASACGLPGAFIYFAADWDVSVAQQGLINAYLDGCASVLGRALTGLYGGFWGCSRARIAGKAVKFWGTLAWSGNNWATCGWQPDVMQGAQVSIGGVSVDLDTGGAAAADFGQWPRPATVTVPAVPGDEDSMLIVTVDRATVPKGTAWPGQFLRLEDLTAPLGVVLRHILDPPHLAALRAAGVADAKAELPYADWLLLGGKP